MHIELNDVCVDYPVSQGVKRAVDSVSLRIGRGERVGIIGRNGAGKTTLLQVMAGLLRPAAGRVDSSGHVNCVMTLGIGLREEMTGRENIYLDGELNGKNRNEVDLLIEGIVEFVDIGEFIERPVRTYSTGMKARLAFALITFIEPEILIIDEALTVGDADFSRKATQKMKNLCAQGKIIILVSHSMDAIRDMCTRCIWMDEGRVVRDGLPAEVTDEYYEAVRAADEVEMRERFKRSVGAHCFVEGHTVESLQFLDSENCSRLVWRSDEEMRVRFEVVSQYRVENPEFKISFERLDGNVLFERFASSDGFSPGPIEGSAIFDIDFGTINFGEQTYEVVVAMYDGSCEDKTILASFCEVIKVDKPVGLLDSPAYYSDVIVSEKML